MPFDLQPILTGELLELRPLRPGDFAALYAVASDPLIWAQHPEPDRYKADVFRTYFDSGVESGGAFLVIDRADGRIVGSARFHGYDDAASEVEIGWTFLARSHWGGRYNRELKRLMLDHAFRFVDHVIFKVGPKNLRSQKAMEQIGGVRVGFSPDSRGHEAIVFRIDRVVMEPGAMFRALDDRPAVKPLAR